MDSRVEWFLAKAVEYLLAPFQSSQSFLKAISGTLSALTEPESKTAWPFLLSSLVLAAALYYIRRRDLPTTRLWSFLFPGNVYRQRSAVVDYKFVLVDLSIKAVVYSPLIAGCSILTYKVLQPITESVTLRLPATPPLMRALMLTVVVVLLGDLASFVSHYLMHRVPMLWPFHEVHHSAEVLTPITVYRVHPVEDLVNGVIGGGANALIAAGYTSLSGSAVDIITIWGLNIVTLFFFMVAFQLRHSHVWLSYGPVLSRLLISPAQHQIHHSIDPKHWNKNFGFMFAIWDALLGTLYVPRAREVVRYGVPGADFRDFATVPRLYWKPFGKSARILTSQARHMVRRRDARELSRHGSASP